MSQPNPTTTSHQSESRIAKFLDIYLLGITILIGGQPFSWNYGMNATFVEFICAVTLMATSYFLLTFCVGEMISALPFSGGLYAFARVALSPYAGFIVGILEILHNAFTLASCVYPVGQALTYNLQTHTNYEPAYWVIIIALSLYGNVIGGKTFWLWNKYMAIAGILVMILYYFTPITNHVDFNQYAMENLSNQHDHNFNWTKFFQYLPMGIWFFLGIELVPFACSSTIKPAHIIPWAMIATLTTVFISSMLVMFIACSQYPGTGMLTLEFMPLTPGLSRFLQISPKAADWFSIPLMIPGIYGFFFGGGRQIWALSTSGLLPAWLKTTTKTTEAPYVALLVEAIFVYVVMIIVKYGCDANTMIFFYLYVLNSAVVYITIFLTFVMFRKRYSNIKRHFINPLGTFGAYLGILINLICIGSIVGMQIGEDFIIAPVSLFVFLFVSSIYYFGFAIKTQTFSTEEQKAFWVTYIINSNTRTKRSKPRSNGASLISSLHSMYSNPPSGRKTVHVPPVKVICKAPSDSMGFGTIRQPSTHFIEDEQGLIDFTKLTDNYQENEFGINDDVSEPNKNVHQSNNNHTNVNHLVEEEGEVELPLDETLDTSIKITHHRSPPIHFEPSPQQSPIQSHHHHNKPHHQTSSTHHDHHSKIAPNKIVPYDSVLEEVNLEDDDYQNINNSNNSNNNTMDEKENK